MHRLFLNKVDQLASGADEKHYLGDKTITLSELQVIAAIMAFVSFFVHSDYSALWLL